MGQAKRKVQEPSPVYIKMSDRDTFDVALISVIESLTLALMDRNSTDIYRMSRLQTMFEKMDQVEKSYRGYIDDPFQNAAKKFVKMLHVDLNAMLLNLKDAKIDTIKL